MFENILSVEFIIPQVLVLARVFVQSGNKQGGENGREMLRNYAFIYVFNKLQVEKMFEASLFCFLFLVG